MSKTVEIDQMTKSRLSEMLCMSKMVGASGEEIPQIWHDN